MFFSKAKTFWQEIVCEIIKGKLETVNLTENTRLISHGLVSDPFIIVIDKIRD